jgi:hypothetical protein
MDATTREETARPLGVIGCLAAGFEMVGRHLWLVILPVMLDLFLWLGPRLSVDPLWQQFVALLATQPVPDPAAASQVTQIAQMLKQLGEQFNMLSILGALPLLNLPSLLASHPPGALSPLGQSSVFEITGVLALLFWWVMLLPVGLLLGFLYLSGVARPVRAMRDADETDPAQEEAGGMEGHSEAASFPGERSSHLYTHGLGKFVRVFLFAAALLALGMVLIPIWMLLIGVVLTVAQPLGLLAWALSIGLGSYVVLHFLFVIPGVLVGQRGLLRAIWESALLIHTNFSSVVGLVLLVLVIYEGLGFVWSLPPGDSWSLLIGILGNSCIATGLTAAIFVYYQERVGRLPELHRMSMSARAGNRNGDG